MNILIIEHPKCGRNWLKNIFTDIGIDDVRMSHVGSAAIRRKFDNEILLPEEFFKNRRKLNKLFLYREPKDVMISFYYQVRDKCNKSKIDYSTTKNISTFIKSIYGIEYLLKYYQVWEEYIDNNNVQIISYEELLKDTFGSIKNICENISFLIDYDIIKEAISKNSFEKMRNDKKRKGIIGDYKNHMSDNDIKFCNKMIEKYPSRFAC